MAFFKETFGTDKAGEIYHIKSPKHKALKKKTGEKYTGKKGEYTKTKQGNWHKVHPLDRI